MTSAVQLLGITAGGLLLLIGLSAWFARGLPDGPVPIHFDFGGQPTAFGSRWIVLGTLPAAWLLFGGLMTGAGFQMADAVAAELLPGQGVALAVLAAAHVFVGRRLRRWARSRG